MKIGVFLFLVLFIAIAIKADAEDSIRSVRFPYFNLYAKLSQANSEIKLSVPGSNQNMEFTSNTKSTIDLGLHYSWLGLEYTFSIPTINTRKYGRTSQNSFNVHYNRKRVIIDYKNKNYKGFYFSNVNKFDRGWDEKANRPQLPNLHTESYLFSVIYLLNPENYYDNATFSYRKKQRKSGGSWTVKSFVIRNAIFADSAIITPEIRQYADPGVNAQDITFTDIGLSMGYTYLWALPVNYFVSLTAMPGISFQHMDKWLSKDGPVTKENRLSGQTIFNFTLGHNSERIYVGLNSYVEARNYGSNLMFELERGGVIFVYRFDTSGWKLMNGVDRVMHPRLLRFALGKYHARE